MPPYPETSVLLPQSQISHKVAFSGAAIFQHTHKYWVSEQSLRQNLVYWRWFALALLWRKDLEPPRSEWKRHRLWEYELISLPLFWRPVCVTVIVSAMLWSSDKMYVGAVPGNKKGRDGATKWDGRWDGGQGQSLVNKRFSERAKFDQCVKISRAIGEEAVSGVMSALLMVRICFVKALV